MVGWNWDIVGLKRDLTLNIEIIKENNMGIF